MKTKQIGQICLLSLITALGVNGATVFSEDFESAVGGLYSAGVITGTAFSVVSGSVDVNSGIDYGWLCAAPASGVCIDTTGSTSTVPGRGVFETTSGLALEGLTTLSFSLVRWNDTQQGGGLQDAVITVTLGSFSESFTVDGSFTNQTIVRVFNQVAPTNAKLRFTDNSGSLHAAGAVVDNISVISAVPEPSTVTLAGLALLSLGFLRRKLGR